MKTIIFFVAVAVVSGCSSVDLVRYEPVVNEPQVKRYINGQPTLFSFGQYTVAMAPTKPVSSGEGNAKFFIMVKNDSDTYIDVGSENVNAFFQKGANISQVRVLSYADMASEIERKVKSRKVANAIGSFGTALSAGAAGARGDTAGQSIENQKSQMYAEDSKIATLEAENKKLNLLSNLFLTQTILPGYYHSGNIILNSNHIDADDNGMFIFRVDISGEKHQLVFNKTKVKE